MRTFPIESVDDYENVSDKDSIRCYKKAWRKIGLRMVDAEKELFIELDKEDSSGIVDIGDEEDDSDYEYDSESEESLGSLKDFIVSDDDDDAFTQADPCISDWVNETHKTVHEYNEWQPVNEREQNVKNFIDRLETKYITKDNDRHFHKGTSGPDYTRPPLKKKKR